MSQTVVSMSCPEASRHGGLDTRSGSNWSAQNEERWELNWAKLTFGISEVMFQSGEIEATEHPSRGSTVITTEKSISVPTPQGPGSSLGGPLVCFYGMREFNIVS